MTMPFRCLEALSTDGGAPSAASCAPRATPMAMFGLEHSRMAYGADFALHGVAVATLAAALMLAGPVGGCRSRRPHSPACWPGPPSNTPCIGFAPHGVRPFSDWHGQHHLRPVALICAPTA